VSWTSKTKLIQSTASTKRPIDFVPHGTVMVLDADMKGTSRFCTEYDGDYVTLASDTLDVAAQAINAGDTVITVSGWVNVPLNSLLSMSSQELVPVSTVSFTRSVADPTQKQTVISLMQPIQNSYLANSQLFLVGFPLQMIGVFPAGSSEIMFDTTEIAVSGDYFATFHMESTVPVLDAWQQINLVQSKQEYLDGSGNVIRRYYCTLTNPLLKDIDPTVLVFMKALPAYESTVLPVQIQGSYHVDAFTGKTFGKGSDSLELSLILYDVNKLPIAIGSDTAVVYAKNAVLVVSAFPASDYVLWNHGTGTVQIQDQGTASFILDSNGCFSVGNTFPLQPVQFASVFTFQDDSVYTLTVTTKTTQTVYVYNIHAQQLTTTTNNSVPVTTTLASPLTVEIIDSATDFVILELSGNCINHSTWTPSGIPTAGQIVLVQNQNTVSGLPAVGYLSYSYRADINIEESWEGACLMLKPAFLTLADLYTDLDNVVLDSGQIFQ
jgi:hypothetical protein